jgi:hypothetical protein
LLGRAEELEDARRREALQRQAQARAAAAAARERQLSALGRRGGEAWQELEQLVTARAYDQAVRLLVDLREVAVRADGLEEFDRRLAEVRQRYARRRAFLDRLSRADARLVGDPTRR